MVFILTPVALIERPSLDSLLWALGTVQSRIDKETLRCSMIVFLRGSTVLFILWALAHLHSVACHSLFIPIMVVWDSPQEIRKDGTVFNSLLYLTAGVYFWEFLMSLDFEWELIRGRKKMRWPLIFYFAGRYALLATLVAELVSLNITHLRVDCRALIVFEELMGGFAIGLASVNLALRTIAIWSHNKYLIAILVMLMIGHFTLICIVASFVKTKWIQGVGCAVVKTNSTIGAIQYSYTMGFDFLILVLNVWKLAFGPRRSPLAALLFRDGLIYFGIAFTVNLIAAVFVLLKLNIVMTVISVIPAATALTIVASRAVRRLSSLYESENSTYVRSAARPTNKETAIRIHMQTLTHSDAIQADVEPALSKTEDESIVGQPLD